MELIMYKNYSDQYNDNSTGSHSFKIMIKIKQYKIP